MRTDGRGVGLAFARHQAAHNSNKQLFTDGTVVWSYGKHWPIAAWVRGQLCLNDDKTSVTTSKHRSFVVGGLVREGADLDTAKRWSDVREFRAFLRACGVDN